MGRGALLMMLPLVPWLQPGPPSGPRDATSLVFSPPALLLELKSLKGEPAKVAWSPEGTSLYVQAVQRDRFGNQKRWHHLVSLADRTLRATDQEPSWAARYWAWKAAPSAPDLPDFKINVEWQQDLVRATAAPMGGDLARGDPNPTMTPEEVINIAQQTQMKVTLALRLKGELLGEWINTPVVPGSTFGWAPAPLGLIAFANRDGRLVVMDERARKQDVKDTEDAQLPAWSADGSRLVYLRQTDKKKFALMMVDVKE